MTEPKPRHLAGLHIAIAVAEGAQQADIASSREALERNGANVRILGASKALGSSISPAVDLSFDQARADDFDGLLVAGGTDARDMLQANEHAAKLLAGMAREGKPVGLVDGDIDATAQDFMKALAERTADSVRGTADGLPGAASMGG